MTGGSQAQSVGKESCCRSCSRLNGVRTWPLPAAKIVHVLLAPLWSRLYLVRNSTGSVELWQAIRPMIWFILSLVGAVFWVWRRHREERRQRYLELHPEAITDWERYVRAQLAIDEANVAARQDRVDQKDNSLVAKSNEPGSIGLESEPEEPLGPQPVVKQLPTKEPARLIGVHPDGRPRWSDE